MANAPNLIGRKFGRLTVVERAPNNKDSQAQWVCRCTCGNMVVRLAGQLRLFEKRGVSQSCGCWKLEISSENGKRQRTHGFTIGPSRRLYDVWRQMLRRCQNEKCKDYRAYGGRGIRVCKAWLDVSTFVAWAWNSGYEPGLTLERKSVNGNYQPSNCTWVPNKLQAQNTRKARRYAYGDHDMCLSEWSRLTGIHVQTLIARLRRRWPISRALTTRPVRGRNQYG